MASSPMPPHFLRRIPSLITSQLSVDSPLLRLSRSSARKISGVERPTSGLIRKRGVSSGRGGATFSTNSPLPVTARRQAVLTLGCHGHRETTSSIHTQVMGPLVLVCEARWQVHGRTIAPNDEGEATGPVPTPLKATSYKANPNRTHTSQSYHAQTQPVRPTSRRTVRSPLREEHGAVRSDVGRPLEEMLFRHGIRCHLVGSPQRRRPVRAPAPEPAPERHALLDVHSEALRRARVLAVQVQSPA